MLIVHSLSPHFTLLSNNLLSSQRKTANFSFSSSLPFPVHNTFPAGFSSDMYNGGNRVLLMIGNYKIPCDILKLHTSLTLIVCFTRYITSTAGIYHSIPTLPYSSPRAVPAEYIDHIFQFSVFSSDGGDFMEVEADCPLCTFTVNIA